MESYAGVYALCLPGPLFYIGSSSNICRRWHRHLQYLYGGRHRCPALQAAFDRLGVSSLRFRVLERSPLQDARVLSAREGAAIAAYVSRFGRAAVLNTLATWAAREFGDLDRAHEFPESFTLQAIRLR